DLWRSLVEPAAGVARAVGGPDTVHGHVGLGRLLGVDLVAIRMDDVGPDGVALDLANRRPGVLAIHRELDNRARGLHPRERLLERLRLHFERLGLTSVPVDHGGDFSVEARLPRSALAGRGARVRREGNDLCHSVRYTS